MDFNHFCLQPPFSNAVVTWHSRRMSVFGRRTFPVLRWTCIWRVTSYMGKSSAAGQPAKPTQRFILSGSIWVVSCNRMSTLVAPSGEYLRGECLVWLIGVVVCSQDPYRGSHCSLARAMDGHIWHYSPLALADQLPLRWLWSAAG